MRSLKVFILFRLRLGSLGLGLHFCGRLCGGDGAEGGVVGVVGDGGAVEVEGVGAGFGAGFRSFDAGEVLAGRGELAVEEGGEREGDELGGGEAEELGEAALDGVEVEGFWEGGRGAAVEDLGFKRAAGAVVVEAELFAAEGGGAALVAVGEEMAAGAEVPGEGHGWSPWVEG